MTKQTAFHNKTSALKAEYVEVFGYDIPQEFKSSTVLDEYKSVREKVGVIDLSYLPKIEILGPDAETLCQTVFTRNIKKMGCKSIVYTAICNEDGGMIDDGTLFRNCENTFRFVCGFPETIEHISKVAKDMELKVIVKDATELYANIAIQGPNSRELLDKVIWMSAHDPKPSKMQPFVLAPARLNYDNGTPLVISRTGYSGELGYEIWCGKDAAEEIWDTIFEAGKEYGIQPFGLGALDLLRVEAGLIFGGYEFDTETDPFEAGIGYVAPMKSKPDNFIGKSAIEKRIASPKKALIGLELDSEVAGGDEIQVDGKTVGKITSAIFSPLLNKNIAMAFVEPNHKEIGTKVSVGSVAGVVVEKPFYDPTRSRMRG
ncbi:MAG: aminomethyltransferase family protein [Alphaproteobacteria bacterium]